MKVVVVGAGYVGLVSGACLAEWGNTVVCVDKDAEKVRRLAAGDVPLHEPRLAPLIAANVRAGRLSFCTDCDAGRAQATRVVLLAVDTPPAADGRPDTAKVTAAAAAATAAFGDYTVVAVKSTVPLGTCDALREVVASAAAQNIGAAARFDVVANPEFLREGTAVADFLRPHRVVIGTAGDAGRRVMDALYEPLHEQGVEFVYTGTAGAELIKYAANAFLATKLGFINEIADLCEALGLDVGDVAAGIGLDPRIGLDFLRAGPGYGGSCFPKDTHGLIAGARASGVALSILESAVRANEARRKGLAARVGRALGGLSGKTVAVLGLTFKPGTDDVRSSPSLDLIAGLRRAGASVAACDPSGVEAARRIARDARYCDDALDAAAGADALVLVTDWDEFARLDWRRIREAMRGNVVCDFRNLCDGERMRELGFRYYPVGAPPTPAPKTRREV